MPGFGRFVAKLMKKKVADPIQLSPKESRAEQARKQQGKEGRGLPANVPLNTPKPFSD